MRGDLSYEIEDSWGKEDWKPSMKMDHQGDDGWDGNEMKLNPIGLVNESASCSAASSVDNDLNQKLERLWRTDFQD